MSQLPDDLKEFIEDFSFLTDRSERAEYLIEIADRFDEVKVPPEISTAPHPELNHVTACESDAYVWAVDNEDGTQTYYFDVLNPQGLSAMAMSVILAEALSGKPLDQVGGVPSDVVFDIFGKEVSMGKGQGLMSIVNMVGAFAKTKQQQIDEASDE
jgi:cysteine desulfuration protein SufE